MSNRLLSTASVAVGLVVFAPMALAQGAPPAMEATIGATVTWGDIEIPGFRSGMKIAVLMGDPGVADQAYTLRLAFPDGYRFPPHWHPRAENVTVLEGTLYLTMGRAFDESKLKAYAPGDYLFIRPENPHFGGAKGRTVIQLHGMGPFEIMVVEGQEMVSK